MPGLTYLTGVAGMILQYVLLGLIYYFLFRIIKAVYRDLHGAQPVHMRRTAPGGDAAPARQPAQLAAVESGNTAMNTTTFFLPENTSIGRGQHNDIGIDNNFVSHEHACITLYNNEYWLADLHSTNGTWLNGTRIKDEVVLHAGDIIKIGDVAFRFER